MPKANFDQATQQFESMFFAPARAYAAMTVDYTEKLLSTQFEFAKAYSEASLGQARALLEIKDTESFRTYVESQQKVAKDLGERLQGDTKKIVAMNQELMQKSQQLAEENTKAATQVATQVATQAK